MHLLGRIVSQLLDALSPACCPACDRPSAEHAFCSDCGRPLALETEALDGVPVLVAGPYRPPLSTAIQRFKYQGRAELSGPLTRLLLPSVSAFGLPEAATLVPVPLHPRRLASRGYNQAALVARELSRSTGLAYRPRLLGRARETERQVGKSRSERLENASGAFVLRQVGARSVVLVDDVITTGSTVRACAQALAAGGVRLAAVVALARAERG